MKDSSFVLSSVLLLNTSSLSFKSWYSAFPLSAKRGSRLIVWVVLLTRLAKEHVRQVIYPLLLMPSQVHSSSGDFVRKNKTASNGRACEAFLALPAEVSPFRGFSAYAIIAHQHHGDTDLCQP